MSPAASDKPRRIHSRYQDGTPVYDGEEPPHLDATRVPMPDPAAESVPHSRLRWDTINGRVYQSRQFRENGVPEHDIDFTRPVDPMGKLRPGHPVPHKQRWHENITGNPQSGYKRSKIREELHERDYFN